MIFSFMVVLADADLHWQFSERLFMYTCPICQDFMMQTKR